MEKLHSDTSRIESLDFVRGLAAFGIMIFHYATWTYGEFDSQTFLGRVGIYGVSIFYVLSGLTLHLVYGSKINTQKDIGVFFIKRFFRIYPLLWLTIIGTIVLTRDIPNPVKLFLNFTGLFGMVQWDQYIGVGVWSIGNELVFYLFLPFLVYLSKKSGKGLIAFSFLLLAIYCEFAFDLLSNSQSLSSQWRDYVNPLNQVFLFLGGFLIGHFSGSKSLSQETSLVLIGVSLATFVFYPIGSDTINMVTGVTRMVFTLICFLICLGFFKLNLKLPSLANSALSRLGEASYSVYLIHPIVFRITGIAISLLTKYFFEMPISGTIRFIGSAIFTLIISNTVYNRFEKYFMAKGKAFSERLKESL